MGRPASLWQADAVRAFLITGNPGSGKSTLAIELSQRGESAIDADDFGDLGGRLRDAGGTTRWR
jgi:hypothetical protein